MLARTKWSYRYLAESPEGFIQQLALNYVGKGYFFYVTGQVNSRDAHVTDKKLTEKYKVLVSPWERSRRERSSAACHYIRFRGVFVLCATEGRHRFFDEERDSEARPLYLDFRRQGLSFAGYHVAHRQGRVHVSVARKEEKRLRAALLSVCLRRSQERLEALFYRIPFEPYAGVFKQVDSIRRAVNSARKKHGLPPVRKTALRSKRRVVKVFQDEVDESARNASSNTRTGLASRNAARSATTKTPGSAYASSDARI